MLVSLEVHALLSCTVSLSKRSYWGKRGSEGRITCGGFQSPDAHCLTLRDTAYQSLG